MAHKERFIDAAGTALLTLVAGGYALWLGVPAVMASFSSQSLPLADVQRIFR
jgi:membrane protein implicated in regulation of membrane protease activity